MKSTIKILIIISFAIILFTSNCVGGGGGSIQFKNLKYRGSMSAYLFDNNNNILVKGKELEVVSKFNFKKKYYSIIWNAIDVSGSEDVINAMNSQIKSVNGDGIINISVVSSDCWLNGWPVLGLTPIWPGCVNVAFAGEIVKSK